MIGLTWVLSIVGVLGVGGAIAAAILAPAIVIPLLQRTIEWILDCRAANAAATLRNQQLDLDIAHRAAEAESNLIKSIEDKASERQAKDNEYIAKLEARPACLLDDSDANGLSNHQSGAGDKKPPRRPK